MFIIFVLCFISLFSACGNNEKLIPKPNKIIVYKLGKAKILNSKDSSFNEILSLTNKRLDKNMLSTVKDGGSINNNYINDLKRSTLSVEFIYTSQQKMEIDNDNFTPIKYYKLFFQLKDLKSNNNNDGYDSHNKTFQYANALNYTGSSRGPLKESKELINTINNINMDMNIDELLKYLD